MNTYADLQKALPIIETRIGYVFKKKSLLMLAFIHCSFSNENRNFTNHNERLEFLGDAILGFLVSDFLYSHLPDHAEGELSYLRDRLVESHACFQYLQKLNVEQFLLVGRGEMMNIGKGTATMRANLFEAIIGAVYVDGGIDKSRSFFFTHFKEDILQIIANPLRNWKAELQDFCQKKYHKPPEYRLIEEKGPDHLKTFFFEVYIDKKLLGKGEGTSKKKGEQQAAKNAIYGLGLH